MADLATLALIGSALGAAVGAVGTIVSGQQANQAAKLEAQQRERQAMEARAVGQKKMFERRKEGDLAQSRLVALAAKSSGDTTDPTILNLGQDIDERTEYGALSELALGENRGRGFEDMAAAARYKGKAALTGSKFSAAGNFLSSVGTFGTQYSKLKNPNQYGYGYGYGASIKTS